MIKIHSFFYVNVVMPNKSEFKQHKKKIYIKYGEILILKKKSIKNLFTVKYSKNKNI